MSASKFFRTLGAVIAVTANAAVQAQVHQNNHNAAHAAEQMEADKWEKRRLQALDNIANGLKYDAGIRLTGDMTMKQKKALRLRDEVNTHCRNRSESLMSYTESQILQFQTSRY